MAASVQDRLVTANQVLANEGILEAFGHVSVRHPEHSRSMLLSRSRSPAFVREADLLEVTLDGKVVGDDRSTYLENGIHRAIYRQRPDVNAVVHHHAPPVLPFTVTDVPFRPAFHKGLLFADGVPKFSDYDVEGGWLVVTDAEGRRMAENLDDHRAQFLEGHGANTVGQSLKEAVYSTYYFVRNARYLLAAMELGEITFSPADPDMIHRTVQDIELSEEAVDRLWEYLTRRLDDTRPLS